MFPVPTLSPSPPGFQPLLASHCPHLPLAGLGGRPRGTHRASHPTPTPTPPPSAPCQKSDRDRYALRAVTRLVQRVEAKCPYCLPQGKHRKGTKTVGLEAPLAPTFHGGREDGRKLGTTALIVRPAPRRTTSLSFPQPCPSDFRRTGPQGRVQGPIVPPPPLLTHPNPLQDAWGSTERGPRTALCLGSGAEAWVLPRSYDKPSCGGSFLAPSRHQPVLQSASDLGGSAWWLGVNM